MIRFNNDYNQGAHPAILEALTQTNDTSYGGYGLDEWCEKAAEKIRQIIECEDAAVHFLIGGTQTNYTALAAALRPYQSVLCAESGHIHVHETGAVENTGHKIEALPAINGKITASQVEAAAIGYETSVVPEHITQPKLVYISQPTEFGTIYSLAELEALHAVCQAHDLYLFIDGARLGYALGAADADFTAADLARLADMFYFGGTKCGALFGEALVIVNKELQPHFRNYMKQNGAMLAKGWLLGIQFYTLFKDDLYFSITRRADELAMRIKGAFGEKGIPSYIESCTNQQFVVVTDEQMNRLSRNYIYEFDRRIDENHCSIRFCTSWSTKEEDVIQLIQDIKNL